MQQQQAKGGGAIKSSKKRFATFKTYFVVLSMTALFFESCMLSQNLLDYSVQEFVLPEMRRQRQNTVFLLPGDENNCTFRFNFICKFWFHVRCKIFADIRKMVVFPNKREDTEKILRVLEPDDVVIFVFRGGSNHKEKPRLLRQFLTLQRNRSSIVSKIRFGIFHIAPEKGRMNWPWYNLSHFVIRMYWMGDNLPPHVMSVPIGPQYPNNCKPLFLTDSFSKLPSNNSTSIFRYRKNMYKASYNNQCRCASSTTIPIKDRPYLWSFTGSLRRKRRRLVRLIKRKKEIKDVGYMRIARKFGGDGTFGSRGSDNPKTLHLNVISKSIFVFAPCGNVMETHRIYEAIILGAIPVIENCEPEWSGFFPFKAIIVNGGPKGLVDFVAYYKDRMDEVEKLQKELLRWWRLYTNELARNVSNVVYKNVPQHLRTSI